MAELRCENCDAVLHVPSGYNQPYLKCPSCGSHQKLPLIDDGPKYRILDSASRNKSQDQTVDLSELSDDKSDNMAISQGPVIADPVKASSERKAAVTAQIPQNYKVVNKPVSEKKILIDALGHNGFEMVLQAVAAYMCELNEKKRQAGRTKAIHRLMHSKIPAELAAKAVDFAEKSPEIEIILWNDYKSALIRGLLIFIAGIIISVVVHFLAHPGWEFIVFQLPFAVGFAYAANAALNMAGLKFQSLRNEKIHYLFILLSVLAIALYIVVGLYF